MYSTNISSKAIIFVYKAWDGYFVRNIYPNSNRIEARCDNNLDVIKETIASNIKVEVFLFHLNFSLTNKFPCDRKDILQYLDSIGIKILNRHVTDITKINVQNLCIKLGIPSTLASINGNPDDRLIVKSNYNFGALREREISKQLANKLGIKKVSPVIRDYKDYKVLKRIDIPKNWWRDPSLIIENFIKNDNGRYYRAYYANSTLVISKAYSNCQIKKMSGKFPRSNWKINGNDIIFISGDSLDILNKGIIRVINKFIDGVNLDYGTIDLVEDNDENFYIVDLNTTPYWGAEKQQNFIETFK